MGGVTMLKNWYEDNLLDLRSRGLSPMFSSSETDGVMLSSIIDLDSSERLGRLIIWKDGAAHLQVLEVATGNPIADEQREITGRVGFEDAVRCLVEYVSNGE